MTKEPVSPSRLNSTLPPALDGLISKAVEKDPDLRHQNAADLRSDLKRLRRDSMMSVSAARTAVEVAERSHAGSLTATARTSAGKYRRHYCRR